MILCFVLHILFSMQQNREHCFPKMYTYQFMIHSNTNILVDYIFSDALDIGLSNHALHSFLKWWKWFGFGLPAPNYMQIFRGGQHRSTDYLIKSAYGLIIGCLKLFAIGYVGVGNITYPVPAFLQHCIYLYILIAASFTIFGALTLVSNY